jgi:nitroreductase
MDKYQERYLAHQKQKARVLKEIMQERHSQRVFDEAPKDWEIKELFKVDNLCPSSCDRKAISLTLVSDRDHLSLLGGFLVGGVGWIYRAPAVFLVVADQRAYKENLDYMPFLDAGVVVGNLYLKAESLGLKGCYVNPNIREDIKLRKQFFTDYFLDGDSDLIFCGAFAVGKVNHER